MSASRDHLAYEIRRLGSRIVDNADEPSDRVPAPPGELALRIAQSFDLRPIDVDVALTILAADVDDEFRRLLTHDGPRTELGILSALVPRLEDRLAVSDAIGRDAPAVKARLLRRIDSTGELTVTRRFRTAVYGRHLLSDLPEYATLIDRAPLDVPWVTPPQGLLESLRETRRSVLCMVSGGAGVGKTTWASHAAHAISGSAIRIDAAKATNAAHAASEIRELLEDAALVGTIAVLDNAQDLLRGETRLALLIEELLDIAPAKIFVVVGEGSNVIERLAARALATVRVEPPGPLFRRRLWDVENNPATSTLADDLVLSPGQITNARTLIAAGADPAVAAFEQLPKTHNLTLPDRSSAKLDMLVLPAEVHGEILELIGAVKARGAVLQTLPSGRGRAITALLDGDSGTGKTFACEVVAAEVGLPLMRVNVSSLVDKYIGETEKNLARVFAQAQAQGGILFFDEADALFGTRTDVSRAQDRYANLETNLLLQLMESFSGVVLLTTNLKKNIDQAFMRRIMFKIYFETPEPPERERLWKTVLGVNLFAPGIDFVRLAKGFELSGGSIRAAVL